MKTFIEIHAIQNFAPSNLNRDDTGAPKDAFFGGTRRARISSQCLKRAVRQHFEIQHKEWLAKRTKRLLGNFKESLTPRLSTLKGGSEDNIRKAIETAITSLGSNKKVKVKDGKTDVLLFLGPREIEDLGSAIVDTFSDLLKEKIPEAVISRMNDCIDGDNRSRMSLDVALFGRMLAVMPEKNQNAACQVAHAISTHAVEREFDYYTAVDDLKPDDTAASDMIGTVEFNSACFYRYAVVDFEKLMENFPKNLPLAVKALGAFLEGFVVAEPTGKQNSFAAHNPPEFVAITVRRNGSPRNLANAFEVPVRSRNGLTAASVQALTDKAQQLQAAYGGEGETFVLNLSQAKVDGFGEPMASLSALIERTLSAVRA